MPMLYSKLAKCRSCFILMYLTSYNYIMVKNFGHSGRNNMARYNNRLRPAPSCMFPIGQVTNIIAIAIIYAVAIYRPCT